MEQLLSQLIMDAEGPIAQRRVMKDMSAIHDKLVSDEEGRQTTGLLELCDLLNMATSSTIASIRPNLFVPPVLACLKKEHSIDLMLLASRALTYMVDSITTSVYVLAAEGGIDILLKHLREVKDIELAEQCMTCLEKITQYSCGASGALQSGGLMAVLGFVDFFSSSTQRKAWTSASAMCRRVDVSNFHLVEGSLADIRARVDHSDGKICERAIACLYRIIVGVRSNPALVAQAFGNVSTALLSVLTRGDVIESTFTMTLVFIGAAVSYSTEVTRVAIEDGLYMCLLALITRSDVPNKATAAAGTTTTTTPTTREGSQAAAPSVASPQERRLSLEQTKTVCIALAGFLPKITEGYLAHGDILTSLLVDRGQEGIGETSRDFALAYKGDYEDEEEEEEMEVEYISHEEVRHRITEDGIPFEKNTRHSKCKIGSHSCDSCGKPCLPGDWYRCNKCADFDFCGHCLLINWEEHVEGKPQHTFCDMYEVFPNAESASAAATTPARPTGRPSGAPDNSLNVERERMYKENPMLLAAVLKGLPRMIALFNESETHIVRNYSMAFIDRAACLASPEQLQQSGIVEASICEMIVAALMELSLILNLQAVFLCRKLIDTLPEIYISAFVREGVTNALTKLQAQSSQPGARRGAASEKKSLTERLSTLAGWRDLVSTEAESILSCFPTLTDASRVERLAEVVLMLQRGELQEAFDALRCALLEETTSFEVSSSNVIHELRNTLALTNDVYVIIALVRTLARESPEASGSPRAPSALTRFVRHLQTVLSHLEQFRSPNFGDVSRINLQIPLRIVPHTANSVVKPKASAQARGTSLSSGVVRRAAPTPAPAPAPAPTPSPSPAPAPKRSSRSGVAARANGGGGGSGGSGGGSNAMGNNSPSSATATGPVPQAQLHSATMTGQLGREATVSVEPLTNIESLMSFIVQNVLAPNADLMRRRAREDDDGQVEDVLPKLNSLEAQAKMPAPVPSPPNIPRVYLRYESHVLPPSMTVLQVLQRYHTPAAKPKGKSGRRALTGMPQSLLAMMEDVQHRSRDVVTVHYSTVPFGPEYTEESIEAAHPGCKGPEDPIAMRIPSIDIRPPAVLAVLRAVQHEFPFSSRFLTVAHKDVLTLLATFHEVLSNWSSLLSLECINRDNKYNINIRDNDGNQGALKVLDEDSSIFSPSTSLGEFIHHKLNNKAMRHCSNLLLAGQHPTIWAVNLALDCNFLFTAATRKYLFQVSFCGTLRSLVQMQENMEKNGIRDLEGLSLRSYRLRREKKRVWRNHALRCAMEIMGKERASGSVVMEFEYYNENGSGLGPTMEFFTLVSNEMRETKLHLWRRSDETPDEKYYRPHNGVYPRPLSPTSPELDSAEPYFLLLGRFLARALLDKRILALSLSPVLLKMLRGDECCVHDLLLVDERLGNAILSLSKAAHSGAATVQIPGSAPCSIEDLSLDFTAPGDDLIELIPDGANTPVTAKRLMEYCDAVTVFLLRTGVARAVKALRVGFHDYIPLHALQMLTVEELHELIYGHTAPVTVEDLEMNCQADHGYTMSCRHVRELFEIIASFSEEEQGRFFLFLTGSAHLPLGGLSSLRPKFTIVRKTASDGRVREQDQLPSAMTCQNYLKLPAYDTKEQMEQKLRQAIDEGCGAFLLT